jgi:ABC-2 type transport system permease protein
MEKIRPTLEDVFVSLTTTQAAEGGGAKHESHRLLAVAKKEVVQIVRDSRSLGIVVIMPVTLMLLFGYGVNLDLKGLPVICLRPGRQPAKPGPAQALSIERVFPYRARGRSSYSSVTRALD